MSVAVDLERGSYGPMTDLTPIPAPDERPGKTQRVSVEGTIATISGISAMIVAVASMFTAVQALNVSQAAAQQKIFENQLSVCIALGDLTSRAVTANEKNGDFPAGPLDADQVTDLGKAMEAQSEILRLMHSQYLQMTMLLPEDVSAKAYAALTRHTDLYNVMVDAYDAGAMSEQNAVKLTLLAGQDEDLMNAASAACSTYVANKAGIKE